MLFYVFKTSSNGLLVWHTGIAYDLIDSGSDDIVDFAPFRESRVL